MYKILDLGLAHELPLIKQGIIWTSPKF